MFWASCSQAMMSQISTSAHDMSTGCPANCLVTQQVAMLLNSNKLRDICWLVEGCECSMMLLMNGQFLLLNHQGANMAQHVQAQHTEQPGCTRAC